MLKPGKVVAGVDVGKVALVAALPEGPSQQFANTPAGHDQLLAWLERQQVDLVVGEPSGGYEQPLARRLHATQRDLCLVPPGRVRAYARVLGQAAKTDPLDARLLARYGEQLNPQPTPPPEATRATLKELLSRRQQLVADRARERNRREQEKSPQVAASLNRHLDWLDQEIAQLDRQYRELLQSSQDLARQAQLYRSVPRHWRPDRRHPGGLAARTGPLERQSPYRPGRLGPPGLKTAANSRATGPFGAAGP